MPDTVQSSETGMSDAAALFSDRELSRLRELASATPTPWWSDYGKLLAAAGFALSLATGMISAFVGYRKDIHDQQAQLASILQTIQELTLKQAEVYDKYKGTSFEATSSNLIVAEMNTALETARELAISLGTNASTAELTTIAQVQYGLGDYSTSEKLLKIALSAAQNANDKSIALRDLGFLKIRNGATRQEGESLFAEAMSLDASYDLQPYAVHFLKALAALEWASAVAPFDCPAAQTHFADGVAQLLSNPRTPEMDQKRRLALSAYKYGIGGVPTCTPTPQTILPQ